MTRDTRFIIGCMTGTSLDGLDVAAVAVRGHGLTITADLLGAGNLPLGDLANTLRHFASGGAAEPIEYLRAARALGVLHADAVEQLRDRLGLSAIDLIVAHGQTIWHAPDEHLSWQLFDPWPLAQRLHATICCDLRQACLIAGGQGAPLTPIADWVLYRRHARRVVNLGGICNVSEWDDAGNFRGRDVGPCNILIDGVVQRLFDQPYDEGGALAAQGNAHPFARDYVDAHPALREGRSLGREDFDDAWVDGFLAAAPEKLSPHDVLRSAVDAVAARIAGPSAIVAGGATRNATLLDAIGDLTLSDAVGIPSEAREAMGFAILGALAQDGVPLTPTQAPLRAGAWIHSD